MNMKIALSAAMMAMAFGLVACGDSSTGSSDSSGNYCNVSYTSTTVTMKMGLNGATYQADGTLKGDRIYYSYKEYYPSASDASEQCEKKKRGNWYTNINCTTHDLTYSDYDEVSIEEAVEDWEDVCDQYAEKYGL